jgi:hypothetical protein
MASRQPLESRDFESVYYQLLFARVEAVTIVIISHMAHAFELRHEKWVTGTWQICRRVATGGGTAIEGHEAILIQLATWRHCQFRTRDVTVLTAWTPTTFEKSVCGWRSRMRFPIASTTPTGCSQTGKHPDNSSLSCLQDDPLG